MRIFILFCVFFISKLCFKAQTNFVKAYHQGSELAVPFISQVHNDYYYVTQKTNPYGFGTSFLYKHNANGTLLYCKFLNVPSVPLLGLKTLDNKLILIGGSQVCDVHLQTQTNYLVKYDTAANTIFQCTYTTNAYENPVSCVQLNDSSYMVFSNSEIAKLSKTGQLIFKINSGLSDISSALKLTNNDILLSAKNLSVNSLVTISPSGTISNVVTAAALMKKLVYFGGQQVMALGNDGILYKYSSNLIPTGQSNFPSQQFVNNLKSAADSLYLTSTSTVLGTSYKICDTSFNVLHNSFTTTDKLYQSDFYLTANNKVAFLVSGVAHNTFSFWSGDQHFFTGINLINKLSANNFVSDIALTSLGVDSLYAVNNGNPAPNVYAITTYLRAKVKVKNVGSKAISSFKLNCYERPDVACGVYYYQELFSNLNIQPGDSMVLTTTSFVTKQYYYSTNDPDVNFCLYVSVPNNEVDKTLIDNELCQNFKVTGIKTEMNKSTNFHIFPNPFSKELNIETSEPILNYKLMDVLGKILFEGNADNKTFNLKTENLLPGIYFLRVETKDGLITKKIVKE